MEITISGTQVTITGDRVIGFALNNLVNRFTATTDLTDEWSYQLYVHMVVPNLYNIINLNWEEGTQNLYVDLTYDMLPYSGKYEMQFVATNGALKGHTEIFEVWVENSISPFEDYGCLPSEFYQFEDSIQQIYDDTKQLYDEIQSGGIFGIEVINGGNALGKIEA